MTLDKVAAEQQGRLTAGGLAHVVVAVLEAEAGLEAPALVATAVTRYCCSGARPSTVQVVGMLTLGLPAWVAAAHVGAGSTQLLAVVPSHWQTARV